MTLSAAAIGEKDNELAKDEVQVMIAIPEMEVATPEEEVNVSKEKDFNYYLYGGILVGLLLTAVLLFIFLKKKKTEEKKRDKLWNDTVVSPPENKKSMDEMTIDGFILSPNALGVLTVLQSDDPAVIGQRFEIVEDATRLGRAGDNEILFPKDSPVSRHHAIIENRNGLLILSEMVSSSGDGSVKSPTFGTYINDIKLTHPTALQNGDQIKLGKRVIMRFESSLPGMEDHDHTMDQYTDNDSDKTMDAF